MSELKFVQTLTHKSNKTSLRESKKYFTIYDYYMYSIFTIIICMEFGICHYHLIDIC